MTEEQRHAIAWRIHRGTASPAEIDTYNQATAEALEKAVAVQIERAQPVERKS